MEYLSGVVERITYQNELNGYAVIRCRVRGYDDLVTAVGVMPDIHAGSVLRLGGSWTVNDKYGQQFAVASCEETMPATLSGMEKYLGSGLIKGIGPKFAQRIVKTFGEDTLSVIEEHPERLSEVPGIGSVRVEKIQQSWAEQKEIKNIMLFLQSHDVSTAQAVKIYKTYESNSISVMKENPYRLADDIWGIGFKTADTIAHKLGFPNDAPVRLRGGLLYALNRLADEGHCYADRSQLLETAATLLDTEKEEPLLPVLEQMISRRDVITDTISPETFSDSPDNHSATSPERSPASCSTTSPENSSNGHSAQPAQAVYLPPFYYAETGTAKRLMEIFTSPRSLRVNIHELPERVQTSTGMFYDEVQMNAITTAAQSKILILTGGPGTGKTTTVQGMIHAFRETGAQILLAAPTGRAAKRLAETTGMDAKTIHRLLEMNPQSGCQRNADNPLKGDVLIVDECSMIDIMLMYQLLKAVPDFMTLIFVGDVDQLPSVGAGNVLRDMIGSGCFPVVRLTHIFRQAQKSRIITNAHRVNAGQMPDLSNGKHTDFFFLERDTPEAAAQTVVELVTERLPRSYHISPADIQVLTPMRRGTVGTVQLNRLLQSAVNPAQILRPDGSVMDVPSFSRGGYDFRVRDKVMQLRNNYEKDVLNGDIGMVERMDSEEHTLTVRFDNHAAVYETSELDELTLAYAATIHKAQGSEYPVVVMPVLTSHFIMLQRNLIYTGITRARKAFVMVGTKKALAIAVKNVSVMRRNTMLKERLRELFRNMPGEQPLLYLFN